MTIDIDSLQDGDKVDMTDEEIEAFNNAESEKMAKLKEKQAKNRAKPRDNKPRNTEVIRGVKGKAPVKVVARCKIGLDDGETSEVGETISLPKAVAQILQDAGKITVKL